MNKQAIKTLEGLYNFKVERQEHKGYTEWKAFRVRTKGKEVPDIGQMFYQWQYIYSSDKGKVSLIKLMDNYYTSSPWEIYSLEGNLFDDVERFATKKQAIKRIREVLLDEK